MTNQFESKVALVTGGNTEIGQSIALAFAREGAKVVVAGQRGPQGDETVSMIMDLGGDAYFVKPDASNTNDVKAMIDAQARLTF